MSRTCRLGGTWLAASLLSAMLLAQEVSPQVEALRGQAEASYQERDFEKTVELSDKILNIANTDHVALYLKGSGQIEIGILTRNGDLVRQGIANSREAIRHEGNGKPEYYLPYIYGMSHLAVLEGKKTHAETGRTVADSVLDREDLTDEQRANLTYQRAQCDVRLRDYPAAEEDLEKALGFKPDHMAAMMLKAEVMADYKTPADAVAAYTDMVKAFPDNPLVYNNRGMYLQSINRPVDALNDFNKAIQLDNKFIPAYINRGFAYQEAGDFANAEIALTQALNVDPQQPGALTMRGNARLQLGKSAEGVADYQKALEQTSKNPMSHANLGFAQFFTGDFAGAVASFKKAAEMDPKARFLAPWKLAAEIRSRQYQQVEYQTSIDRPAEQRDWVDSLILFQLGQVDATSLLKSVHPDDANARDAQLCEGYYFIGMELVRRNRSQDAIGYFQQAAKRELPKLAAYRGAVFALRQAGAEVPK